MKEASKFEKAKKISIHHILKNIIMMRPYFMSFESIKCIKYVGKNYTKLNKRKFHEINALLKLAQKS